MKKFFLFSFSLFNVHNIISLSHHERKRLMNVISLLYYFNQYFTKTLDIIIVLHECNKFICSKKMENIHLLINPSYEFLSMSYFSSQSRSVYLLYIVFKKAE